MEKQKHSKDFLAGIPISEIIASAREGNSVAVEQLLRHFQSDIRSFARGVCSTPEDAEDATQHALFAISRQIPIFHKTARFTSWVFSIVKHECYRFFKRAKRFVELDESQQLNAQDAVDALAQEELFTLVQRSIVQFEPASPSIKVRLLASPV